jgi:hypothetical protein
MPGPAGLNRVGGALFRLTRRCRKRRVSEVGGPDAGLYGVPSQDLPQIFSDFSALGMSAQSRERGLVLRVRARSWSSTVVD